MLASAARRPVSEPLTRLDTAAMMAAAQLETCAPSSASRPMTVPRVSLQIAARRCARREDCGLTSESVQVSSGLLLWGGHRRVAPSPTGRVRISLRRQTMPRRGSDAILEVNSHPTTADPTRGRPDSTCAQQAFCRTQQNRGAFAQRHAAACCWARPEAKAEHRSARPSRPSCACAAVAPQPPPSRLVGSVLGAYTGHAPRWTPNAGPWWVRHRTAGPTGSRRPSCAEVDRPPLTLGAAEPVGPFLQRPRSAATVCPRRGGDEANRRPLPCWPRMNRSRPRPAGRPTTRPGHRTVRPTPGRPALPNTAARSARDRQRQNATLPSRGSLPTGDPARLTSAGHVRAKLMAWWWSGSG
jgi:hypothetical protein